VALSQALDDREEEVEEAGPESEDDSEDNANTEGEAEEATTSNQQDVGRVPTPVVHGYYEYPQPPQPTLYHYPGPEVVPPQLPLVFVNLFEATYPQPQGSSFPEWVPTQLFATPQSEDGVYAADPHDTIPPMM